MKLLAFDTSTNSCSVAVLDTAKADDARITSQSETLPMQQGKLILPMINAVLETAGIALTELDAISYGQGPGSYTGTRIAAGVAQGLGFTLGCPIVPISSMLAMAQASYLKHKWERVLVAIDARSQEIYWAAYEASQQHLMTLIGEEHVSTPTAMSTPFSASEWYAVGDGWDAYDEILSKSMLQQPKVKDVHTAELATAMVYLAASKLEKNEWIKPDKALPIYLR